MELRRRLARQIAPFAAGALLGFALVSIQNRVDWVEYGLAAVLTLVVIGVAVLAPWPKIPRGARMIPALLFLVAMALLRDGGGGNVSGVGTLALLPVFWLALHGTRRQLFVIVPGVCAFYLAPILFIGGTRYPSGWRTSVVFAAVAAIIGFTTQNLVARERGHAKDLVDRERDLEKVTDLARTLSGSVDARERICAAACDLSGAYLAVLLEPQSDGTLVSTAEAGLSLSPLTLAPNEPSWAMAAFTSRTAIFVDPSEHADTDWAIYEAAGRPAAVLIEPVRRGEQAVGVLVVGWRQTPTDPRRTTGLIRMLASEAAFAIERADLLGRLTEIASTDALTGLPNRRAWDACLTEAMGDAEPFCVAMLDLDLFKSFNDDLGHQTGDRMLREAAAAWRDELRPTDVLARYGGEEFAALLPGCDLEAALAIVERLRAATPRDQSCSAGIARREDGEDPIALVGRADEALYAAKQAGRDRSVIA